MTIEVIDDFLPINQYKQVHEFMNSFDIPWFLNNGKVDNEDGIAQFTHAFWKNHGIQSHYIKWIGCLMDAFKFNALVKVKANLTFGRPELLTTKFHVDGLDAKLDGRTTAIFYLSDTNGPLLFKDPEQEVECKQNRLVKFDAHHEHAGVLHEGDPSSRRIVINFNYY